MGQHQPAQLTAEDPSPDHRMVSRGSSSSVIPVLQNFAFYRVISTLSDDITLKVTLGRAESAEWHVKAEKEERMGWMCASRGSPFTCITCLLLLGVPSVPYIGVKIQRNQFLWFIRTFSKLLQLLIDCLFKGMIDKTVPPSGNFDKSLKNSQRIQN